jgi:hypothetical protein
MGKIAPQLQNRFLPLVTPLSLWLAGSASADAISPATAAGGTIPGVAYAAAFGGNSPMAAEIFLFVAGVLLVTLLCCGWLAYLMLTAPAEQEPEAMQPPAAAGVSEARSIRARIGSLLGHAGPV